VQSRAKNVIADCKRPGIGESPRMQAMVEIPMTMGTSLSARIWGRTGPTFFNWQAQLLFRGSPGQKCESRRAVANPLSCSQAREKAPP
jgi:hypothetical protein